METRKFFSYVMFHLLKFSGDNALLLNHRNTLRTPFIRLKSKLGFNKLSVVEYRKRKVYFWETPIWEGFQLAEDVWGTLIWYNVTLQFQHSQWFILTLCHVYLTMIWNDIRVLSAKLILQLLESVFRVVKTHWKKKWYWHTTGNKHCEALHF